MSSTCETNTFLNGRARKDIISRRRKNKTSTANIKVIARGMSIANPICAFFNAACGQRVMWVLGWVRGVRGVPAIIDRDIKCEYKVTMKQIRSENMCFNFEVRVYVCVGVCLHYVRTCVRACVIMCISDCICYCACKCMYMCMCMRVFTILCKCVLNFLESTSLVCILSLRWFLIF